MYLKNVAIESRFKKNN